RGSSFEDLENSGNVRFSFIDARLAVKLVPTVPMALKQRISKKETEALRNNKTLTGRQMAWLIFDYYRTDTNMSSMCGVRDLLKLSWKGDGISEMEKFLKDWDFLVRNIDTDFTEDAYRDIMFEAMKDSAALREDMSHYRRVRAKGGVHPDNSLGYLRQAIESYIKEKRYEQNLDLRSKFFEKGKRDDKKNENVFPVLDAEGKGKGKGKKGKDKGKEKGKTQKGDERRGATPWTAVPKAGAEVKEAEKPKFKCYFFNLFKRKKGPDCTLGKNCKYAHEMMSDKDFEEVTAKIERVRKRAEERKAEKKAATVPNPRAPASAPAAVCRDDMDSDASANDGAVAATACAVVDETTEGIRNGGGGLAAAKSTAYDAELNGDLGGGLAAKSFGDFDKINAKLADGRETVKHNGSRCNQTGVDGEEVAAPGQQVDNDWLVDTGCGRDL
ncbi:MAG: hypothetical protein GY768_28055, partial [Planctomycetaceae bacterium]|nr:hypothetical protein [Planctomycetaceae bacterium]